MADVSQTQMTAADKRRARWLIPVVALVVGGVAALYLRPRRAQNATEPNASTEARPAASAAKRAEADAPRPDINRPVGAASDFVEARSLVEFRSEQARKAAENRRKLIAGNIAFLEEAAIKAEGDGHPERAALMRRRIQLLKQRADEE